MAELHAVSESRHGNKAWCRLDNFLFASSDSLCPLASQELPKAMMGAPIAFILQGESYLPVMVQGLYPDSNLLISDQGHWRGRYLPLKYRHHPFFLAPNEKQALVLCLDEDSGVLCDKGTPDSFDFFDSDGKATDTTQMLLKDLKAHHEGLLSAKKLTEILVSNSLIKAWNLELAIADEKLQVNGLYCVDEEKLNALEADTFLQLRDSRALLLAYCQLFSMTHAQGFARLLPVPDQALTQELCFDEESGGTISFDNL